MNGDRFLRHNAIKAMFMSKMPRRSDVQTPICVCTNANRGTTIMMFLAMHAQMATSETTMKQFMFSATARPSNQLCARGASFGQKILTIREGSRQYHFFCIVHTNVDHRACPHIV